MFEKIAATLSGRYEVHVFGCRSSAASGDGPVHQHPYRPFARISIRRLITPWRIFFSALRLNPALFIATTHELLLPAVLLKKLKGCAVIYDVQENYYWNILYTPAFPLLVKPFIAFFVRGKETLAAKYVDHFFLAEKGYEQELKFPGARKTVLENKARIPHFKRSHTVPLASREEIRLVFSGTLAETTGVFTAIELAVKLHVLDDRIRLTIIGCGAQKKVLDRIRLLSQVRPFIHLVAQNTPLPHAAILEEIQKADFGLICYEINPSTMNAIPTKLYEYLGFRLPILLVNHQPWVEVCAPYTAAVVFQAAHFDAADVYAKMMQTEFYPVEPREVYWETEEPKLLSVVDDVVGRVGSHS